MDHKVNSIKGFYEDSYNLLTIVVENDNDNVLNKISSAIDLLKSTWKGKDAGVQIMNAISAYNELVELRNSLSRIASLCLIMASKYRKIQRINGAKLDEYYESKLEDFNKLPEYTDNSDTVSIIPEAESGAILLENAVQDMEVLLGTIKDYKERIFNNWQKGAKEREQALATFEEFINSANKYSEKLTSVTGSVRQALINYQF